MQPLSLGPNLFMCHPATYMSSHNVSVHCAVEYMILLKNIKILDNYIILVFEIDRTAVLPDLHHIVPKYYKLLYLYC